LRDIDDDAAGDSFRRIADRLASQIARQSGKTVVVGRGLIARQR
jgi:hypothetical protein